MSLEIRAHQIVTYLHLQITHIMGYIVNGIKQKHVSNIVIYKLIYIFLLTIVIEIEKFTIESQALMLLSLGQLAHTN